MSDDLRHIKEEVLPALGYCLARPVSRLDSGFMGNSNWMDDLACDWSKNDAAQKLDFMKTCTYGKHNAFQYGSWGVLKRAYDAHQTPHAGAVWNVTFFNLRLVDVDEMEFPPVDVDMSQVELVEVMKETNGNASFKAVETELEKLETKEEDHSFSVEAETEFETQLNRSAEAGIEGVASGKEEFMARFKARIAARTDNAWRKSDTLKSIFKESYNIFPFSVREISVKRGKPTIRQKIPTRGILECGVSIYIASGRGPEMHWEFPDLDKAAKVFGGVQPGYGKLSEHFGQQPRPEAEIDAWPRPRLNLDLEIKGTRVRYSEKVDNGYPVPGKEKEYEEARRAYNEGVTGGSR